MARNRTTWKPGQSGNPKGRPPRAVEDAYTLALFKAMTPERFEKVCQVHAALAEAGDLGEFRTWLERLMGKVTLDVNLLATLAGGVSVEVVERIVGVDEQTDTTGDSATPAPGGLPG